MIPVLDDTAFLIGSGVGVLIVVYLALRHSMGLSQEEAFSVVALLLAIAGVIIMLSVGGVR